MKTSKNFIKKKYTFYLSFDTVKKLKKICVDLDMKVSNKIEELIEDFLKKAKDK